MFGEASQLDLTFPLESAHGFGQENGASELRRNAHYTKKAFVGQNLINQM